MSVTATAEKYMQLSGHVGAVYAVAPAGPGLVFTAGSDGIIAKWDTGDGTPWGAVARVEAPLFSLMFDPGTHRLWAGREDGGLHVIDTAGRRELRLLKNHAQGVFSVLRAGNRVYTSGGDGTVALIHPETLETETVFRASEKKVRGLYYDTAHDRLYTASADGMLRCFTGDGKRQLLQWAAHEWAANAVAELPGNRLLSGGRDARLKIWEPDGDRAMPAENIPAHNYAIYRIAVFPETGIFITCSRDKTIKIWDIHTREVLTRISRQTAGGHRNSVNDFVFDAATGRLVSVGDDGAVMVWNVALRNTPA